MCERERGGVHIYIVFVIESGKKEHTVYVTSSTEFFFPPVIRPSSEISAHSQIADRLFYLSRPGNVKVSLCSKIRPFIVLRN